MYFTCHSFLFLTTGTKMYNCPWRQDSCWHNAKLKTSQCVSNTVKSPKHREICLFYSYIKLIFVYFTFSSCLTSTFLMCVKRVQALTLGHNVFFIPSWCIFYILLICTSFVFILHYRCQRGWVSCFVHSSFSWGRGAWPEKSLERWRRDAPCCVEGRPYSLRPHCHCH